jgi:S1-C subfamily serine protease
LGDSDKVRVGDVCLAVGNPLGVGESVTNGIISAKGRETSVSTGSFQDFLQTDAPINQGNSGGALVNTRAELIGINSQIISSTGGNIGIGFAIPSNMAKNVMNQLVKGGKVQRGMLGVGIQTVTGDLAASMGLKEMRGVVINSVSSGGPAARAGLKVGDVILKLNGKEVTDANTLRNEIAGMGPGTVATLTISRNGQMQDVRAALGDLSSASAERSSPGDGAASGQKLGITVTPLTPDLAARVNVPRGTHGLVVTDVDPSGPAAQAGIQAGDVIREINRQPVTSVADLQKALAKSADQPPLLLIDRAGETVFVPVPLG